MVDHMPATTPAAAQAARAQEGTVLDFSNIYTDRLVRLVRLARQGVAVHPAHLAAAEAELTRRLVDWA
jgi:hypothetical protein